MGSQICRRSRAIMAFKARLNGDHMFEGDKLLKVIAQNITEDQNEQLSAFPSIKEIHDTVKNMNGDSAARPNGFNAFFFSICSYDLYDAITEFFAAGELPKSGTCTTIIHVPKIDNPTSFKHLRPISLCNFSNKIIAKILMVRLSSILPTLISHEQSGLHGRMIHDDILSTQELLSTIKKKIRETNIIIKSDISKSYDFLS